MLEFTYALTAFIHLSPARDCDGMLCPGLVGFTFFVGSSFFLGICLRSFENLSDDMFDVGSPRRGRGLMGVCA